MNVLSIPAGAGSLFSTSHVLDAPDGLVVFDTPMLTSDGRRLAAELQKLERPLAAIVLTHPHPDHVNGTTEVFRTFGARPVYALETTAAVLREIDAPKRAFWSKQYPDDYPSSTVFPDRIVADGATVEVAGATIAAIDTGAGECAASAVWIVESEPPLVFAGDLVYGDMHPWLAEGRTALWLAQLERIKRRLPSSAQLFIGHGKGGNTSIIDDQVAYLNHFRSVVADEAKGRETLTDDQRATIVRAIRDAFPTYGLADLIGPGADAVARELSAENTALTAST